MDHHSSTILTIPEEESVLGDRSVIKTRRQRGLARSPPPPSPRPPLTQSQPAVITGEVDSEDTAAAADDVNMAIGDLTFLPPVLARRPDYGNDVTWNTAALDCNSDRSNDVAGNAAAAAALDRGSGDCHANHTWNLAPVPIRENLSAPTSPINRKPETKNASMRGGNMTFEFSGVFDRSSGLGGSGDVTWNAAAAAPPPQPPSSAQPPLLTDELCGDLTFMAGSPHKTTFDHTTRSADMTWNAAPTSAGPDPRFANASINDMSTAASMIERECDLIDATWNRYEASPANAAHTSWANGSRSVGNLTFMPGADEESGDNFGDMSVNAESPGATDRDRFAAPPPSEQSTLLVANVHDAEMEVSSGNRFASPVQQRKRIVAKDADNSKIANLGCDEDGNVYLCYTDEDLNVAVYKEYPDREMWDLVANNRDELLALTMRLRNRFSEKKAEHTVECTDDTSESEVAGQVDSVAAPPEPLLTAAEAEALSPRRPLDGWKRKCAAAADDEVLATPLRAVAATNATLHPADLHQLARGECSSKRSAADDASSDRRSRLRMMSTEEKLLPVVLPAGPYDRTVEHLVPMLADEDRRTEDKIAILKTLITLLETRILKPIGILRPQFLKILSDLMTPVTETFNTETVTVCLSVLDELSMPDAKNLRLALRHFFHDLLKQIIRCRGVVEPVSETSLVNAEKAEGILRRFH